MNDIFIDTNILIYFSQEKNEFNGKVKTKLKDLIKENQLFISNQIILEYLNIITNEKIFKENALSIKNAISNIDLFLNFIKVTEKQNDYLSLKKALLNYGLTRNKIFDLNIYLTMQSNKIDTIFTANKKDFEIFKDIKILVI